MPCSRTQHGLTRVGLEPRTYGSGVRGIDHQATALIDSTIPLLPKFQASSFCGCTAQFVSDLVGDPEDRFSLFAAHF